MKAPIENPPSTGSLIKSSNPFPVVGIGASAGGLDAFKKLITAIPENSGMAYVLVQHLNPSHESLLPELIQKVTNIPVLEIADEIKVQPNHIYIIPANTMLVATDGVLRLTPRPPKDKNVRNLPIDLFFTSLAEVHQDQAIGVVLSGTASDGTQGLKAIRDNGGITFAQDEASAAFEGMPQSAVQAGVVDFILPPEKIPKKLLEITNITNGKDAEVQNLPQQDEDVFKQILSLLRLRKGTDFTYYKQTTIRRRILRRMAFNKNQEPSTYLTYLRGNKAEQDTLYQDLLIPVTNFFRDTKSFENLCESVFPNILNNKTSGEAIRIWIAGCSTGEEAYSIAICLKEFLDEKTEKVQIYATDLSEPAIAKARTGIYTKEQVDGISPQRLQDFFSKTNGNYQVKKNIREMCVFAVHNFLKDPPFGKMDFISCRNVLIYMEPYLQKKALTTFHYALKREGCLLLGKSETAGSVSDLFSPILKTDKLFSRKDGPGKFMALVTQRSEQNIRDLNANPNTELIRTDFQKTAEDIILRKYTPAGVVINEAFDIVHFTGSTAKFLEQASGKPSHNLLKMAKEGLAFELRNLLHKTKKEKAPVIKEGIPVQINGNQRKISIESIPLTNIIDPHYLILFHEAQITPPPPRSSNASSRLKKDEKEERIQQLEQELAQSREDMRSITEDQEAANEELQSANEELLSGSEELQSLNEELETGKEELQSTNEELTVLNSELVSLNEQVTDARNFAVAIIANIHEPLLVLDNNLRIVTCNKAFYKTFLLNEHETEGKLLYELGNGEWAIPELKDLLEKTLPERSNFTEFEVRQHFSKIGDRILLLNANEILKENSSERLILLAIEDITESKLVKSIKESELQFRQIADSMPQMVWTAKPDGYIDYYNKQWYEFNGSYDGYGDQSWTPILHPDDVERCLQTYYDSINTGKDYQIEYRFKDRKNPGTYKWFMGRALPVKDEEGKIIKWFGTCTDIDDQKNKAEVLEQAVHQRTKELASTLDKLEEKNEKLDKMNKELKSFAYVSSHDLQEPLRKIQTFASRIFEKEHHNLSDTGKDYFNRMKNAAKRMQALIDDLFAFTKITATEAKFEKTDLNNIIEEVCADFNDELQQKSGTIEVGGVFEAEIIPFQFRQLFYNLIGNALKFSRPDIPPYITIKGELIKYSEINNPNLPANKEYCHISIADNGIGFEKEFSEKIFEVFQRLHSKEEFAGTGIGLSIVKKIVENHNGAIIATSEIHKGAKFDIYIPASK